jgi:uncharacterized protein YjdB
VSFEVTINSIRITNITGTITVQGGATITGPYVDIGSTTRIYAYISPLNATNQKVSRTISDSTIATILEVVERYNYVYVRGESLGTTTITVTTEDGNKTATGALMVEGRPITPPSDISATATSSSITVSRSCTLCHQIPHINW